MKTTGQKITELRVKMKLNQAQLAEKMGVTQRPISKYETDVVIPSRANLVRLCEVFGVTEAYLLKPEIDDPTYHAAEEPYISTVRQQYGGKAAAEIDNLLSGVQTLFAGGDVPQEDKDLFFQAVMQAYLDTKQEAHEKFTPQKYKE